MKRFITAVITGVALSGCATDPIATSETNVVPTDRVWSRAYTASGADTGTVIVKRDTGYAGIACASRLSVDSKSTADLRTGERIELHIPAGEHILSVAPSGPCGGGLKETGATVKAGSTTIYRIGYGTSGDLTFSPTAF